MKKIFSVLLMLSGCILLSCSIDDLFNETEGNNEFPEGTTHIPIEDAIKSVEDMLDFLDNTDTRSGKNKRTIANYYLLGEIRLQDHPTERRPKNLFSMLLTSQITKALR